MRTLAKPEHSIIQFGSLSHIVIGFVAIKLYNRTVLSVAHVAKMFLR